MPSIRAGGWEVAQLRITNDDGFDEDIKGLLIDCQINMSIYNKAIFGSLKILDGVGLHYACPLLGEEKIEMIFNSSGRAVKSFNGRILKMSSPQYDDNYHSITYTLDFVSETGFQNLIAPKVSHYIKTAPDLAVESIVNNFLDGGGWSSKFIETFPGTDGPTPYANDVEIIFPKVSPFKAIDMIAARTYSNYISRSSLFTFYEDLDAYRFLNIDELFNQNSDVPNYFFDVFENEYYNIRDKEFYRIVNMSFNSKFDTQSKINNGMLDSSLIRFDPVKKQISSRDTTMSKMAYDLTGLDSYNFINANREDFLHEIEFDKNKSKDIGRTSVQSFKVESDFDPFDYKALAYGKTMAMFEALQQIRIDITVPGHTGRKPGDVINIPGMPRGTTYADGTNAEEYLQGRFLVVGVKHAFTLVQGSTVLTLAKPTLAQKIESKEITL